MTVHFKKKLREQIGFLQRSSNLFDLGYIDEALRIATSIRVLMYDTRNSTSLLTHLQAKDIMLCSCEGDGKGDEDILWKGGGLFRFSINHPTKGSHIEPYCYGMNPKYKYTLVPLKVWNNQIIVKQEGVTIRRCDIYLDAANTDGGAHVDETLSHDYEHVKNGCGWVMTRIIDGQKKVFPIPNTHYVMLRQMADELLKSEELTNLQY